MLFNSIQFLIFFTAVTIIYYWLPHRLRWIELLIASCIFYCAFIPAYLLILLFTIGVDYCAALLIERSRGPRRRMFLVASIVANLGVLAVFKYADFFISNVNEIAGILHLPVSPIPLAHIILPIGLSFHTFQAMSYTIEVYRGTQKAERHVGIYSLYVLFFPQLVAGPIERPGRLLPQFYNEKVFDNGKTIEGLRLILWGLFKKTVVADQLSYSVDRVFDNWQHFHGLSVLIAVWAFAIQIYCDFSGYSDIARGCARILGFELSINFSFPYFARSVTEFWRRWHITLSSWFRDYVYIPLGGNRNGTWRTLLNILITMVLAGFWHGATWTFVVWGLLHGILLCFDKVIRLPQRLSVVITFNLVAFAWIFFRAGTLAQCFHMIGSIFDLSGYAGSEWHDFRFQPIAIVALFAVMELALYKADDYVFVDSLRQKTANLSYILFLTFCIILFGASGNQFIYFQF